MDKGDRTRELLLEKALESFRTKGFEATTMRDLASEAGLSLGAAYYYFESKEALVAAYYERVQDAHDAALAATLHTHETLADRVRLVWATKLRLIEGDRRFLGTLFAFAGVPGHPLSVFSAATADVRARSIAPYARVLDGFLDDPAHVALAAEALWFAHLGLMLHLLHDRTPGFERTNAVVDFAAEAVEQVVALTRLPFAGLFVDRLIERLAALPVNPPPSEFQPMRPRRRTTRAARSSR